MACIYEYGGYAIQDVSYRPGMSGRNVNPGKECMGFDLHTRRSEANIKSRHKK
jgi:hypothetical protein